MPKNKKPKFSTEYAVSIGNEYNIETALAKRQGLSFYFGSVSKKYDLDPSRKIENNALIKKISEWSKMSYSDIVSNSKYQMGSEFIGVSQLKKPLPSKYFSKDINNVLVLRFKGKDCRLIGVYSPSEGIFDVAFVDYNLKLYDH